MHKKLLEQIYGTYMPLICNGRVGGNTQRCSLSHRHTSRASRAHRRESARCRYHKITRPKATKYNWKETVAPWTVGMGLSGILPTLASQDRCPVDAHRRNQRVHSHGLLAERANASIKYYTILVIAKRQTWRTGDGGVGSASRDRALAGTMCLVTNQQADTSEEWGARRPRLSEIHAIIQRHQL
jgi:hypothetical protein